MRTVYLMVLLFFMISSHANEASKNFNFSGFSRVVVGTLDDKNASFEGYDNSISFSQRSLLAIQLEANISEKVSVTTQLLAHSSETRDSGVEWLYLTYRPTKSIRFKAGRMRTPFFTYSDVLDVGFAYPWISPPQQVYNAYLFDYLDGVSASYEYSAADFGIEFEAYIGEFDDTINVGNTSEEKAKATNFSGLSILFKSDKLQIRASTHSGETEFEIPELDQFSSMLRLASFNQTADSLVSKGNARLNQLGVTYDELDYFLKAEWIGISSPILIVPNINSYYLTAGYNLFPFTFHATYANNSVSYEDMLTEIPYGLSPQVDALAAGYSNIYNSLDDDSVKSLSIGVRWDFNISMALKAELTHLKGKQGERSFFNITNPEDFDRRANLVQVAWEWVF